MTPAIPTTALQLRSLVKPIGELELSLLSIPVPSPAADEVLIQVQATPLNPSDIGLLFGPADVTTAKATGTANSPVVSMQIAQAAMISMAGRMGQSMPVGNEGAGLVVAAGASPAAQALLGKTVAVLGGAMYSQYRNVKADQCLVLPAGTTAAEGASCYVNPLTALGFIETLRHEGKRPANPILKSSTRLRYTASIPGVQRWGSSSCRREFGQVGSLVRMSLR